MAHATAVAGSVGRLGFQLSTVAVARGRLNPDASELLLFGNAGRTGTPRTFELDGSRMDAAVFTAAALAYGLPVDEMAGGRLAAGATVTFTVGHALVAGRDAGSSLGADPVLVDVRFPLLTPRTPRGNDHASTGGTGVGLDLGARWLRGRVELGATFRNVVNTFAWRLDRLAFRPGTALFDQELSETDFEPRPGVEAPAVLREAADGLGFAREVELGAAWRVHDDVEIVGGVRRRLTEGLPLAPRTQAAGGVRTRLTDRVELAGHLGASERGAGIGAGATVLLGAFRISGAGAWGTGVVDAGSTWSLSASWEG